jgi:hypothetical protein
MGGEKKKARKPGSGWVASLRVLWQRAAGTAPGSGQPGWTRAALCCVLIVLVLLTVQRTLLDPGASALAVKRGVGLGGSSAAAVVTDTAVTPPPTAGGSAAQIESGGLLAQLAGGKAPSADPIAANAGERAGSAKESSAASTTTTTNAQTTTGGTLPPKPPPSPESGFVTPSTPPSLASAATPSPLLPLNAPTTTATTSRTAPIGPDAIVPITPIAPSMSPKEWFDAGFYDQLPPLDYGMDGDAGPDGKRAYGKHPHYMPRCHTCFHHKFMFVTLEGNHEKEIVRNLKIVMCHMKGLPADCGEHFIDQDCSVFSHIDAKDWFIFTFVMDPHSRAISSWTEGLRRDLLKARIPEHLIEDRLRGEEKSCPFRSYVMWASGLDRSAGMSCPFSRPDHQYEAIFTSQMLPAVNYVGRIEYYNRDILAVLQLIDPNGDMVEYHKQHAVEFGLHEDWHPEDWRQFYKDGGVPDTWSLVGRQWQKDIEMLKYPAGIL